MSPIAKGAALSIVTALLASCALLLDLPDSLPTGSDAQTDAAAPDGDTCLHSLPPPRPVVDPTDGGQLDLVLAVDNVDFGRDAGDGGIARYGFDLDRTCTCPGPESCIGVQPHCDEPGGRDNSGGMLFEMLNLLAFPSLDPEAVINGRIASGRANTLFELRNYNGQLDDDSVAFSVYGSDGTEPKDDAGVGPIPLHDGNDVWDVDSNSVQGGTTATIPYTSHYVDDNAYVVGGVLVAYLDFPLRSVGTEPAPLKGTYLTGTLVPQGSTYRLSSGMLAGRWTTRDLLTSLQAVKDPLNPSQYLCPSDAGADAKPSTYTTLKQKICGAADISSNLLADQTATCDALSIAFGFTAEPAQLGVVRPAPTPYTPCGPAYTDQCGP